MSHLPFHSVLRTVFISTLILFAWMGPRSALAQNVGINTTTPEAGLHVEDDDGILIIGEYGMGALPYTGFGARLMWHPKTASFRAGRLTDEDGGIYEDWWQFFNTGDYSFVNGINSKASGYASFASGHKNQATNDDAFAAGGFGNVASGTRSFVTGYKNTAPSFGEAVFGVNALEYTPGSTMSYVGTDRLFVIGNGESETARSNALTILKNGNTGIGTVSPLAKFHVSGNVMVDDSLASENFKMTNGAGINKLLQSDNNGNASWVDPSAVFSDDWNASGNDIYNTNTSNVGVGTISPSDKLHVVGNIRVDGGRINISNSGESVFVGRDAGLNDDLTANQNVFIGEFAGTSNTTGNNNIALGANAFRSSTSSSNNIAIGKSSLYSNTSGNQNVSIGTFALDLNTTGSANVAVGYESLGNLTTTNFNTAFGYKALFASTGNENTAIGAEAGLTATGSFNVFIGNAAGSYETGNNKLYIDNSSTSTPLLFGDFANNHLTINDSLESKYLQITQGATSGHVLVSDAQGNANWTNPQSLSSSFWSPQGGNIYRESNVGINTNNPQSALHAVGDIEIETGRLLFSLTNESVLIGTDAGLNNAGSDNVFIGENSGLSNTSGSNNISMGENSFTANTTGGNNIAIGNFGLGSNITGSNNIGLGPFSLLSTNSFNNIGIGAHSLEINSSGEENIALGVFAGYSSTGDRNIFIGHQSGFSNTGEGNVFLGIEAGFNETGSNKLYVDNSNTSSPLLYGDFSTNHLTINDSVTSKTIRVDGGRLSFINSGNSVFIGNNAGKNDDLSANENIYIGEAAGKLNVTGSENIAIGSNACGNSTATSHNIAIGKSALASNITGTTNVAIGSYALDVNTSGASNTAIGFEALGNSSTSNSNCAVGYKALGFATGTTSIAVGYEAGLNSAGNGNVFLGHQAGSAETGSNKLYIDNSSTSAPLIFGNFSTNKVTINDSLATKYFQLTNGATSNYVLKSDNTGKGTWTEPSLLFHDINMNNLFIGDEVGDMVTTAVDNTIVGPYAGVDLTTGYENTGLGFWSLFNTTTGVSNTAIGHNTLANNITGNQNTALGWSALAGTTGSYNTGLGGGAGGENTSGSRNVYLGYYAGFNNQGSDNVFIGHKAGEDETGSNKLYIDNTDSASPLIYGDFTSNEVTINDSLKTNTFRVDGGRVSFTNTGSSIFIGRNSGKSDDHTDNRNVFIGESAGYSTTTGQFNIAIGESALYNSVTTNNNVAIGKSALASNTDGGSNVAIGTFNLDVNTTGNGNISIGNEVLGANTTGSYNTAVGHAAGAFATGSYNTSIGFRAGRDATGSNNVFIGSDAGLNETASNRLYIDNSSTTTPLIYGNFFTNEVTINDSLSVTKELSVGTSVAKSTLEVNGSVAAKFKTPLAAGTDNPDDTGMVWRYNSGTGTITLPAASTCANRMYVIINQTGSTRTISTYRDLTTTNQTSIGSSVALWLMSDGTEWWQIK